MHRSLNESEKSAPPVSEDANTNLLSILATLEAGTQAGSSYTQLADASTSTSAPEIHMQPSRMRVDAIRENPDIFQYYRGYSCDVMHRVTGHWPTP